MYPNITLCFHYVNCQRTLLDSLRVVDTPAPLAGHFVFAKFSLSLTRSLTRILKYDGISFPSPSLPFCLPFFRVFAFLSSVCTLVCARIGGKNTLNFYLCRKRKSSVNQALHGNFSPTFGTKKIKRKRATKFYSFGKEGGF